MKSHFTLLLGVGTSLLVAFCARANEPITAFIQNFETAEATSFAPVGGVAQTGSTVEISTEQKHSGEKAVKVNYQFSGRGAVEVRLAQPPLLPMPVEHKFEVSLWVYGASAKTFANPVLRLVDANNESFQYVTNAAFTEALNGTGWQEVRFTADVTKHQSHWGDKADGVPDTPLRLRGFVFDHRTEDAIKGQIFFDDIKIVPAAPTTQQP